MIAASLASTLSLALCAYLKCPRQAVERQIERRKRVSMEMFLNPQKW